MDEKKALKRSASLSVLWILIALLAIAGATYAWFTFSSATNIEPNQGSTISDGDASLLIANSKNGNFDKECKLLVDNADGELVPVSTDSLDAFYKSIAQDTSGISILYADATADVPSSTLHGSVYLTCEQGALDVYFFGPRLNFGQDTQALAAMRLGLKITKGNNARTYILNLDSMGDTSGAKRTVTVPENGTVVASANNDGTAKYVKDPAEDIASYFASVTGKDDTAPKAGRNKLTTVNEGEIVQVEYWLYLEGCDDNCSNPVQSKDVALQLSFAGVPTN